MIIIPGTSPALAPFDKQQARKGIKQGTFDFLGFTIYWGKSRAGRIIPKQKTRTKTMQTKLKKVKDWVKQERNMMPLKKLWIRFVSKLRGHVQYYGVSHNVKSVQQFLYEATRIIFKWLNRLCGAVCGAVYDNDDNHAIYFFFDKKHQWMRNWHNSLHKLVIK